MASMALILSEGLEEAVATWQITKESKAQKGSLGTRIGKRDKAYLTLRILPQAVLLTH